MRVASSARALICVGLSLSLCTSFAAAPAPRARYWCASLLEAAARVESARGIGETVGRPRDLVREALDDVGFAGVIERLRARVRQLFRRHSPLNFRVEGGEADIRDAARALARLDGLARDLRRPAGPRTPVRLVLRGSVAIRDFLNRQMQVAENLEAGHPAEPSAVKPPFAWEPAVDVGMVIGVAALWTGVTVGLFDPEKPMSYFYFLADAMVVGLTARPFGAAVAELRQNWRDRRARAPVARADVWRDTNLDVLRRLGRDDPFDPELVIYSSYAISLPSGLGRPLDAALVAGAAMIRRARGRSGRRLRVDQIIQIDPVTGQPALTLILRD